MSLLQTALAPTGPSSSSPKSALGSVQIHVEPSTTCWGQRALGGLFLGLAASSQHVGTQWGESSAFPK